MLGAVTGCAVHLGKTAETSTELLNGIEPHYLGGSLDTRKKND